MTKETYETNERKPSEWFVEALQGGGSSSIYCNCGRMHYAPENLMDSEDETDYPNMLADVTEEKRKDPDGIIIHTNADFVYCKEIDGKVFAVDCPCNGLTRYEDFIWANRNSIRRYLKARTDQENQWAQEELTLNKLAGI